MSVAQFQVSRSHHDAGRHGAALTALSDAAEWIFGTIGVWVRRTRERDQLARMNDRLLADIGITRADALLLTSKPFWKE
jgi:uncharacterized protein YjiS (DUF1127 family)